MSAASGSSVSEIVGFKGVGKVDKGVLPGKGPATESTDLWGAWRPGVIIPPKGWNKGKSQEPPKGKGKGKSQEPSKGKATGKGPK